MSENKNWNLSSETNLYYDVLDNENNFVCHVAKHDLNVKGKENLNLILCAPEMLEMLEKIKNIENDSFRLRSFDVDRLKSDIETLIQKIRTL